MPRLAAAKRLDRMQADAVPRRGHPTVTPRTILFSLLLAGACALPSRAASAEVADGLLFALSADHGTTADFSAAGTPAPTFDSDVTSVADGVRGAALRCGQFQRLAWRAPGNIYAQRGSLSFFWRARYPVGPTAFPIFRVGYADHSSWDMVWLRLDYNGHGFDAFVTDTGLARTRVSVPLAPFPAPDRWIHLAFSWDETRGVRLYVDGRLAAAKETTAVYDAGLDQFGPHSRIISPYQVQSDYNFIRGGDLDELRIYDHMLDDGEIAHLAADRTPAVLPAADAFAFTGTLDSRPPPRAPRSLADPALRAEWDRRYGWDDPDHLPPLLAAAQVAVRKVEIHDAYDQKRWWWKANDGIRETTWPGVYNRSRLPGRHDYFELPDWDCYSTSGRAITFTLPDEPWNQLEITGAAWGRLTLGADTAAPLLAERPRGHEHTEHALAAPQSGGKVTFTNIQQEEPIAEFEALLVAPGTAPAASPALTYTLAVPTAAETDAFAATDLGRFIAGRHPADERATLIARPGAADFAPKLPSLPSTLNSPTPSALPLVHLVVPDDWDARTDGLDGMTLDLPPLALAPTHGGLLALNLRVKDPLWPARDALEFSFCVRPGEPHTLWLDLRDRLLPTNRPLHLTLACSSPGFGPSSLVGAGLRLLFKPREVARPEHELDRFTQARDAYAMLVEEHPRSDKLALWVRFRQDLEDLLRVNPDHDLGRRYAAVAGLPGAQPPPIVLADPPPGVPLWAARQTELLDRVRRFVLWYVEHRQLANGEFGGGISDDTDLTNPWPGLALMGVEPERLRRSLHDLLEAAYANGMFTRGLPTIQTDELHTYEEGINCLAQNLLLDYGNPRQLERAMETIRGIETVTGVNAAGHRHLRSSYFSGTRLATEEPWGWAKGYGLLILHPAYLVTDYNGSPAARRLVVELADGLLAHRKPAGGSNSLPCAVQFTTDAEGEAPRTLFPWPLFWAAWRWTGEARYLAPIADGGLTYYSTINANALDLLSLRAEWRERLAAAEVIRPPETRRVEPRTRSIDGAFRSSNAAHFAWQLTGDKSLLADLYTKQIGQCDLLDYINTEGSLWSDRVAVPYVDLQRARLGGVALARNALYPGHVVSWHFATADAANATPVDGRSVAILLPDATPTAVNVIAYNLATVPVRASMTGWDVAPGEWEIQQGVDTNDDDRADTAEVAPRTARFERTRALDFMLPPRATTILTLKHKTPGTPYWQRPDLGLERRDITVAVDALTVRVHSLGAKPAPTMPLVVRDAAGRIVARTTTPALPAPDDLFPKTADVTLPLPAGFALAGASVELDPDGTVEEITTHNNRATL